MAGAVSYARPMSPGWRSCGAGRVPWRSPWSRASPAAARSRRGAAPSPRTSSTLTGGQEAPAHPASAAPYCASGVVLPSGTARARGPFLHTPSHPPLMHGPFFRTPNPRSHLAHPKNTVPYRSPPMHITSLHPKTPVPSHRLPTRAPRPAHPKITLPYFTPQTPAPILPITPCPRSALPARPKHHPLPAAPCCPYPPWGTPGAPASRAGAERGTHRALALAYRGARRKQAAQLRRLEAQAGALRGQHARRAQALARRLHALEQGTPGSETCI